MIAYIELAKIRIQSNPDLAQNTRCVLVYVMDKILRLLHPFMPFITEEIWQSLPHEGVSIMLADYPKFSHEFVDANAENSVKSMIDVIKGVRNRRAEMNVVPSKKTNLFISTENVELFEDCALFIQKLAYAKEVHIGAHFDLSDAVTVVTSDAKVLIPTDELIDRDAEISRLKKELESTQKELNQNLSKLNNSGFLSKAPQNVIEEVKKNAKILSEKCTILQNSLDSFLKNG